MKRYRTSTSGPVLPVITVLLILCLGTVDFATAQAVPEWQTGRALAEQLAKPAGAFLAEKPLRDAVADLSAARQVAVLLDRRLDPSRKLTLSLGNVRLDLALERIAAEVDAQTARIGSVLYIGPTRAGAELRTLVELRREEARRMEPPVVRRFASKQAIRWADFATPRDLLSQLATENDLELIDLDRVPHDLWSGCDLPPLTLIERLTLIVGQFDLTFRIAEDGRRLALVDIPDDLGIVRNYPGGPQPDVVAQKYRDLIPLAQVKVVEDRVYVKGLLDEHERLAAPKRPAGSPADTSSSKGPSEQTRFTANVINEPLDGVLEYFANRLQLDLIIDDGAMDAAGIGMEQLISFKVDEATLDELFRAILKPVGCTHRRRGGTIEIAPATD